MEKNWRIQLLQLSKALDGKRLKKIYRSGKELRFEFDGSILAGIHLMLTGDCSFLIRKMTHHSTIVELYFEGGKNLALTDRMRNAYFRLNPVDKAGVDALELDFKYLKNILNRKTTIKNILLDQDLIRGIGNGYSDEILWETRISPYSIASAIPDDKIQELVKVIPRLLTGAAKKIDKAYPGKINDEVKRVFKNSPQVRIRVRLEDQFRLTPKGSRKTYYTDEQVLCTLKRKV